MKIAIYMETTFELELCSADVAPLLILCAYHYDSVCRSAGKEGGFIYGWRNITASQPGNPGGVEPVAVSANRRQLDTLLKCCEGASAAELSRLITREQHKDIDRLCGLVLSALEQGTQIRAKYEPVVLTEATKRGQLLWSTSPGRW